MVPYVINDVFLIIKKDIQPHNVLSFYDFNMYEAILKSFHRVDEDASSAKNISHTETVFGLLGGYGKGRTPAETEAIT